MKETLQELRSQLGEISDIRSMIALAQWDQETYMPPKAAQARGRQLSTMSGLAHRMFTSKEMGDLLKKLSDRRDRLSDNEAVLVDETLYDYNRDTRLPEEFVRTMAEERSKAFDAWKQAKYEKDFQKFRPHLETLVSLLKQKTDYMGYEGSPYNALLEDFERGMTVESLKETFSTLAKEQTRMVSQIQQSNRKPDLQWLNKEWDVDTQWQFTLRVILDLGFDLEAGRQDRSVHPFTTNFDLYDVRITTRLNPNELFSGLTGSIHECGHALYEQGFRDEDQRTPLAEPISLGVHESQSRLWENLIGRSLPFWKCYTPVLQQFFPRQLDDKQPEDIYRAINNVEPSFIRVEADECTYNLHVIIRFEIELALIEGELEVKDIPEVWNQKMKEYLGLDVPDDSLGCLQDVHWSHGAMGYFPTYTLGNLYAAQLFETIQEEIPDLWNQVENGRFDSLLQWLRKNVHQVGRRKTAPQLIRDCTGREPGPDSFLRYVKTKYGNLYNLSL